MSDNKQNKFLLTKVHLKGFKSIEDLSVELTKGLNILIGKNGSGKSNFLELLKDVIRFEGNHELNFNLATFELFYNQHVLLFSKEKPSLNPKDKKGNLRGKLLQKVLLDNVIIYDDSNSVEIDSDEFVEGFIDEVGGTTYGSGAIFSLLEQKIEVLFLPFKIPEYINYVSQPESITMEKGGLFFWEFADSIGFIDQLIRDFEGEYIWQEEQIIDRDVIEDEFIIPEDVINNLMLYSPIKNLRLNDSYSIYDSEKNVIVANLRLDFYVNGNWMPWSYLSDGTKRLFYIIAEVTHKKNGVIIIEEPELGVHPEQFHLLMNFLKEQAEDKQIIISTHSPKALDTLGPDELDHILIAEYNNQEGTVIRKMTENQIHKAHEYMGKVGFLSDYWLMSDLEND